MKQIGKHLAELRKKNHYKQTELAEKLSVSQQVISNIERGLTEPDIAFLKGAADLYNISLDQLVGRNFIEKDLDLITKFTLRYSITIEKAVSKVYKKKDFKIIIVILSR